MLDMLRQRVRRGEALDADRIAGIIDSQTVEAADTVGRDTCGFDVGKKVPGHKCFIVTDTRPADRPDRIRCQRAGP